MMNINDLVNQIQTAVREMEDSGLLDEIAKQPHKEDTEPVQETGDAKDEED